MVQIYTDVNTVPITDAYTMIIAAAVNDDQVLEQNLASSPLIRSGQAKLIPFRSAICASEAFGACISRVNEDLIVFAHQDVYLPAQWNWQLAKAIRKLNKFDPHWAVLGPFGRTVDRQYVGRIWSNGIGGEIGGQLNVPQPVVSLDELVLVLRADAGVEFDRNLPDFHLYGTDIVAIAKAMGRTAYAFDGPVIHNSLPVRQLGKGYGDAYRYMQRKWHDRLPLQTCVVPVTRFGYPLLKYRMRATIKSCLRRRKPVARHGNPAAIAQELGYERRTTVQAHDEWTT